MWRQVIGWFYAPIGLFVSNPMACVAMAAGFAMLMLLRPVWAPQQPPGIRRLWIPSVVWLLFGWGEWAARRQGLDVRVDLLVTGPIMYVVSVWGALLWLRNPRRP